MEADGMMQEMWRAYELVGKLQSHIIHGGGGGGGGEGGGSSPSTGQSSPVEKELAGLICREAMHSCDAALSQLIKDYSSSPSPSTSPSSSLSPLLPSSPSLMSSRLSTPRPAGPTAGGGHGRKKGRDLEEKLTFSPFDDGHHWRKYGEKKIAGTDFRRCYYRCSYKEDKKCQAKMRMQQRDNQNPPLYHVVYDKKHTCNIQSLDAFNKFHLDSTLPQAEPFQRIYHPEIFETKQEKSSNLSFVTQLDYAGDGSGSDLLQCDSTPRVKQDILPSPYLNTSSRYCDAEDHFRRADFSSSINLQSYPPNDIHSLASNVEMVNTTSTPLGFGEFSDEEIQKLLEVLI